MVVRHACFDLLIDFLTPVLFFKICCCQIEWIFSDKTGTLTCNEMKLRRCSVGGIMYGLASDSGAFHSSTMWNILNGGNGNGGNGGNGNGGNGSGGSSSSSSLRTRELSDFWTCLSVCHTVVVEEEDVPASQEQEEEADHHSHHSHNNSRQSIDRLTQATRSGSAHRLPRPIGLKKRVYRAESPDEGALFRLGYGYFAWI